MIEMLLALAVGFMVGGASGYLLAIRRKVTRVIMIGGGGGGGNGRRP